MNKIYTKNARIGMVSLLLFLLSALTLLSQTPTTFNYQAVLRDGDGYILETSNVSIQLVIHQGAADGTTAYSEVHNSTTSEFGLVNLEIGSVTPATFASIDWSAGPYFVEVIVNGTSMGASELLTVPYALYAVNGVPGPQGDQGIQGEKGDKGDPGDPGVITDNSVGSNHVIDNSLTGDDLADGSVGSSEVSDNSLTADDLAVGSVGSSEVSDNTLTADDLATGSVGTAEVEDNSLTAADLAPNSVDASEIATGAVGTAEVADNSLTTSDLATNSVGAAEIAAGAVGTSEVADNSLAAVDLAPNSVGSSELGSNAVNTGSIVDGAIINADVNAAAGISATKISGDVGFDYVSLSSSFTWATGAMDSRTLAQVSITAPTSGYVYVIHTGYLYCDLEDRLMRVGLGTQPLVETTFVNCGRPEGSGVVTLYEPYTVSTVYSVTAGTHTYYAIGEGLTTGTNGSAVMFPKTMLVIFFPKRY